jgi:hypothetical protein
MQVRLMISHRHGHTVLTPTLRSGASVEFTFECTSNGEWRKGKEAARYFGSECQEAARYFGSECQEAARYFGSECLDFHLEDLAGEAHGGHDDLLVAMSHHQQRCLERARLKEPRVLLLQLPATRACECTGRRTCVHTKTCINVDMHTCIHHPLPCSMYIMHLLPRVPHREYKTCALLGCQLSRTCTSEVVGGRLLCNRSQLVSSAHLSCRQQRRDKIRMHGAQLPGCMYHDTKICKHKHMITSRPQNERLLRMGQILHKLTCKNSKGGVSNVWLARR